MQREKHILFDGHVKFILSLGTAMCRKHLQLPFSGSEAV